MTQPPNSFLPPEVQELIRALIVERGKLGYRIHAALSELNKAILRACLPTRALTGWISRQLNGQTMSLAQAEHLRRVAFFDGPWYLRTYTDVALAAVDPLEHYLRHGAAEGRSPGPLFDAAAYLRAYPDVATARTDPILHYLRFGAAERRSLFTHLAPVENSQASASFPKLEFGDAYKLFRTIDGWSPSEAEALQVALSQSGKRPRISVLMPVYKPDLQLLAEAVGSVCEQVYSDWELCIADDATGSAELSRWLADLQASQPRIKVVTRPERGHISAATNSAAELATGEFLLLLDQDDLLAPDALARCVLAITDTPDVDYIFSDSDKIDKEGGHFAPYFKPDFSPELLLTHMCAGQIVCIRTDLWRRLGGLRIGFEGSQDHDLALRATELARHVVHIPKVLYHWRSVPGSIAHDANAKPYSFLAGQQAVQEALQRRGSRGRARRPDWAIAAANAAFEVDFEDDGPTVGIVIPTYNRLDLIRTCIESLARTSYRRFEILIVDNGSDDADVLAWLEALPASSPIPVRILRAPNAPGTSFNFSRLVNAGVRSLETEFVVLLNNDVRVIAPQWLSTLVGYGQMPGVGAVGALLLYPDGTVQHGGVYNSDQPPNWVGHMYHRADPLIAELRLARNTSAVTAACMLVRRSTYLSVGGFDEERFAVAYNDVDFCNRLRAAGSRIVFAHAALLCHDENATRGAIDNPAELRALHERYGVVGDVYNNRNLSGLPHPSPQPRRLPLLPPHPIRLLMATHNLERQGAPLALFETARWISERRMATITVRSPVDGPLRLAFEQCGAQVEIMPLQHAGSPIEYETEIEERGRGMQARGFDVVLANTLLEFHTVDAAHGAGLPTIWLIHENEGWRHYFEPLPEMVRRRALACFGHPYRVVFVSSASCNVYRELDFHHNATVVPGGVPPMWQNSIPAASRRSVRAQIGVMDNDVVVLSVGTICERKRQADLVFALARLGPSGTHVQLIFCGAIDPAYRPVMERALNNLPPELRARVQLLPERDEMAAIYGAADVFVLCSSQESYPRVVLEAMASGLPIVTTPAGGVVEQVQAGVNAEFFPAGDVDALAVLLRSLVDDPKRRNRYGAASREISHILNTSDDVAQSLWNLVAEARGSSVLPSRLDELQI